MKTHKNLALLILFLPALLISACSSPTATVANANYAAGRLFATIELGNSTSNAVTVTNVVSALRSLASVTTAPTPYQMGVLSGQVQVLKSAGATNPNSAITDIASVVDTAVQLYKASAGSNPTILTAANAAMIQDFINGVVDEESFLAGQAAGMAPTTTTTTETRQP